MPREFAPPVHAQFGQLLFKQYEPGLVFAPHAHDYAVVILVLVGSFTERVGGPVDERRPGWLRVLPPDCRHSNMYGLAGAKCALAAVDADTMLGNRPAERAFLKPAHLPPTHRAAQLFRAMAYRARTQPRDDFTALELEGLCLQFVAAVGRREPPISGRIVPWLNRIHEALAEHTSEPSSVAALAADAGVSPSYLSRSFRAAFGCSPATFALAARIDRAKRLLVESDDSISSIALSCGFYDHSHFARRFVRATGYAPAAFRELFACD